ncbi:MAG: GTP-binding protein, partial [Muribaculaceae bacterium]|nr:GTP-binding protein [Muribaculaceae bacterium]
MMNKEIPVLLLTGYLGSGKTTLLNRILTNEKGIRFAVVVNDIGEVNIDASLIQKGGIVGGKDEGDLVALQNGCICCTLKMDLVAQLWDIASTGRFDYIVIEASGICEPEPIAQTICAIRALDPRYDRDGATVPVLDCICTVVDALRMATEFGCGEALRSPAIGEEDIESLVIQQIEFCNVVLLNKVSEVTPEQAAQIEQVIRALQPAARIIPCDYADVDFDELLGTGAFDFEATATSATWVRELEGHHDDDDDDDDDDDHDHHHEHEHHHDHEEHEHDDHDEHHHH